MTDTPVPGVLKREQSSWMTSRLAAGGAFRPRVAVFALAPLSAGSILVDGLGQGSALPFALYSALLSFMVAAAWFVGLGWLVNRFLPHIGGRRTIATIGVFAGTEIIRTVSFVAMMMANGNDVDLLIGHRLLAGGLTGILLLGVSSLVVNDRDDYLREYRHLAMRQKELGNGLVMLHDSIDWFVDDLRTTIRQSVEAALRPLRHELATKYSPKKMVAAMVKISENVVRPMSEQITTALPITTGAEPPVRSVPLRQLVQLATVTKPFQPAVMMTTIFLLFFSASIFLLSFPRGIIFLASTIALVGASHFVGERFVLGRLEKWHLATRIAVISVLYVSGLLATSMWLLFSRGPSALAEQAPTVAYLVLIFLVVSWGIATLPALRAGRDTILRELAHTTSQLNEVRARSEVRLRREKQRLASIVHGDIQSILMATVLRIQGAGVTQKDAMEALSDAEQRIHESLNRAGREVIPVTVDDLHTMISLLWEGMVDIEWSVDPGLDGVFLGNPDFAETVTQVVREAATNAVKHGNATSMDVTIRIVPEEAAIVVEVANNGTPPKKTPRPGGGNRLFDAVSDHVELARREDKTVLSVHLTHPNNHQRKLLPLRETSGTPS